MRTQQEAERAEQQRIKNLVLKLDLRDENEHDGDSNFLLNPNPNHKRVNRLNTDYSALILQPNPNHRKRFDHSRDSSASQDCAAKAQQPATTNSFSLSHHVQDQFTETTDTTVSLDKSPYGATNATRIDKAGNNRSNQRARKLQLSDVDWYGRRSPLSASASPARSSSLSRLAKQGRSSEKTGITSYEEHFPSLSSQQPVRGRRSNR